MERMIAATIHKLSNANYTAHPLIVNISPNHFHQAQQGSKDSIVGIRLNLGMQNLSPFRHYIQHDSSMHERVA